MSIPTEVLVKGPAHFNQCGQKLSTPLYESDECIDQDLAERLLAYASDSIRSLGLDHLINNWEVKVGTLDGKDTSPDDRAYYVDWVNPEGTVISIVGILIKNGKPVVDHGVDIQSN
jgi:hypothetical protein